MTLPKIDIPNALIPKPDILTGGQPTPQQLEQAKQAGYRTIVNLRPAAEMSEWSEEDKGYSSDSTMFRYQWLAVPDSPLKIRKSCMRYWKSLKIIP